jgi:hypothetical protein
MSAAGQTISELLMLLAMFLLPAGFLLSSRPRAYRLCTMALLGTSALWMLMELYDGFVVDQAQEITIHYRRFTRSEHPYYFWVSVAFFGGGIAYVLYQGARFLMKPMLWWEAAAERVPRSILWQLLAIALLVVWVWLFATFLSE